jgi:hypothetical protein
MRWNRRRAWPQTGDNGRPVPGEVKTVSIRGLSRLTEDAIAAGWSARGRPGWLESRTRRIKRCYLTARIVESPGVLRRLVTIFLQDDMVAFTLDVSDSTFYRLPTITADEVVDLLHGYMATAPFVPLDWASDRQT